MLTPNWVRDAVVARYLETGEASTVRDIATRVGYSESTVRKVIAECHGAVPGTTYEEVARVSHSRNYRGMQAGSHKVGEFMPSMSHMRDLLIKAREQIASAETDRNVEQAQRAAGEG